MPTKTTSENHAKKGLNKVVSIRKNVPEKPDLVREFQKMCRKDALDHLSNALGAMGFNFQPTPDDNFTEQLLELLVAAADPRGSYLVLSSIENRRTKCLVKAYNEDSIVVLNQAFQEYSDDFMTNYNKEL